MRQLARLTGGFREPPNVRDLVRDVESEVGAPLSSRGFVSNARRWARPISREGRPRVRRAKQEPEVI